jgi:hypothetical protein
MNSQEELSGRCPLCGAEYDHKRTEPKGIINSVRRDVVECRQEIDNPRTDEVRVFVHYNARFPEAKTMVARKETDSENSLIDSLFRGKP